MSQEVLIHEEKYIHDLLLYREREEWLQNREERLRKTEPQSISHDVVLQLMDEHYDNQPHALKVCSDLSLTFGAMFAQDMTSLDPREYFVDHYFQIVATAIDEDFNSVRLNPNGSCSDELRQATKMLLHELGVDYPGKVPFYDKPLPARALHAVKDDAILPPWQ